MPDDPTTVYSNPRCSKFRSARALLEERSAEAIYVHYTSRLHPTAPSSSSGCGERAVVARPPERLLELWSDLA